jgi:hypothetical protein
MMLKYGYISIVKYVCLLLGLSAKRWFQITLPRNTGVHESMLKFRLLISNKGRHIIGVVHNQYNKILSVLNFFCCAIYRYQYRQIFNDGTKK